MCRACEPSNSYVELAVVPAVHELEDSKTIQQQCGVSVVPVGLRVEDLG